MAKVEPVVEANIANTGFFRDGSRVAHSLRLEKANTDVMIATFYAIFS